MGSSYSFTRMKYGICFRLNGHRKSWASCLLLTKTLSTWIWRNSLEIVSLYYMDLGKLRKNCAVSKFKRLIKSKVPLHQGHHLLHVLQIRNKIPAILGSCLPILYAEIPHCRYFKLNKGLSSHGFLSAFLCFSLRNSWANVPETSRGTIKSFRVYFIYLETMRIFLIKGLLKKTQDSRIWIRNLQQFIHGKMRRTGAQQCNNYLGAQQSITREIGYQ